MTKLTENAFRDVNIAFANELSLIADQTVQKRLTSVEGVARVTPLGLVTRQVRIDLDPQRLRGFGLTPADVSAALVRAMAGRAVDTAGSMGLGDVETVQWVVAALGVEEDEPALVAAMAWRAGQLRWGGF